MTYLKTLRGLLKPVVRMVPVAATRVDYARFAMTRIPQMVTLGDAEQQLCVSIAEQGYAVVPNFASREECERMIADFEQMVREHPEHVRRYSDTRVFGAEEYSEGIARFHYDSKLQKMSNHYSNTLTVNALTLANKVETHPNSKGSGEGWHKDSSFRQFKAFLYLNDVDESCGPLELIANSHRLEDYVSDIRSGRLTFRELRITEAQIEAILSRDPSRLRTLTGKAGTLILADTASIHRGRPPAGGTRYALTNYYLEPGQIHEEFIAAFHPVNADRVRALGASGGSRS
jgi:hypothetical protein